MELDIKDEKLVFTYESIEYSIPGELYPLTSKNLDDISLTSMYDFFEIQDAKLLRILDNIPLEMGRCYENSEKIYQALKANDYDARFYSGWLFTGKEPPIHHAWIIVEVQGKQHLIDSTNNKIVSTLAKKINKSQPAKDRDESRKIFAELYQQELKKRKRNTDRITTGKPPKGFAYLGVESNFEETLALFLELIKIKDHPSYRGGMKLGGDSKLQEQLRNRG